jgi:hypothetical protein
MTYLIKKSTHFAKANMVALFFPVWEEHFQISRRGKITGELHRLSMKAIKAAISAGTEPTFPALSSLFTFRGQTYHNRRTDFLSALTDQQYIALFRRIHNLDDTAAFPN